MVWAICFVIWSTNIATLLALSYRGHKLREEEMLEFAATCIGLLVWVVFGTTWTLLAGNMYIANVKDASSHFAFWSPYCIGSLITLSLSAERWSFKAFLKRTLIIIGRVY